MQKLNELTAFFLERFRNNPDFEEVQFCRAFPFVQKPTRLQLPVVAVSLSKIELGDAAVGDCVKAGAFSLCLKLYFDCGSDIQQCEKLLCALCGSVFDCNLCSVSAGALHYDSETDCLLLEAELTFYDRIDFGG